MHPTSSWFQTPSIGAPTPTSTRIPTHVLNRGSPHVSSEVSTPRGSPGQGRGRPRRPQSSLSLPWSPPRASQQVTPQGSSTTMNQADLQLQLRTLLQDEQQVAAR